jgi:hypothetical protein
MDPAYGFAHPSLACAKEIWERRLKPASAANALPDMVISAAHFDRGGGLKQRN